MAEYAWRENLACLATYKVLEDDHLMDQFEDINTPFAKGGELEMGSLRYYPKTTSNPALIELLALTKAHEFLTFVAKLYTMKKELPAETSASIIRAVAKVFEKESATLAQLASVLDAKLKFPDEGAAQ